MLIAYYQNGQRCVNLKESLRTALFSSVKQHCNMRTILTFLVISVVQVNAQSDKDATITYYSRKTDYPNDAFEYKTSNHIHHKESTVLENPDSDEAYIRKIGSYSYRDPDGYQILVTYEADDKGFRSMYRRFKAPNDTSVRVGGSLPLIDLHPVPFG